jgi:8-oxo-dGTP pyrophosphatase MutT (NUDIX family)
MPSGSLGIHYEEESRELPPELLREASAHWESLQGGGQVLFDGALSHLLSHSSDKGTLSLKLGRSSYKLWMHSSGRQQEIEERFGRGTPSRPLALCVALIDSEGKLLLQRRSQQVAEGAGLLHVPGGHLDPDLHRQGGIPCPETAMKAELREELGLEDLFGGELLALIENLENGKPELLYRFHTSLDFQSLLERAARARDRFEYDSLHFWRPGEKLPPGEIAVPCRALLERISEV